MSTRLFPYRIPELVLVLACAGCTLEAPYERLSTYGYFESELTQLKPAANVYPYEVVSELWADGSHKERFIYLPPGSVIGPSPEEDWAFPVGAVVIKNFSFWNDMRDPGAGIRRIETRLLVREEAGWTAHVYLWNDDQSEATRLPGGKRVPVSFIDHDGAPVTHDYVVPNTNQCGYCHARDDVNQLLGIIGPQLVRDVDRDGQRVPQLEWAAAQGLFGPGGAPQVTAPFVDPYGDAPVEARARSWLHANCAHCHRLGGNGGSSGLVLLAWETDAYKLGVCKSPAAAGSGTGGHDYDILPGDPAASIMPFRILSTDPEIKMPELPNRIPDERGLAAVEAWIAGMPAGCQ